MRALLVFVVGAVFGVLIQTAVAQRQSPGVIQLNHVGVAVDDVDESLAFYTQTLGFDEVFRVTNDAGQLGLAYLRVSENTFVEIMPANGERPAGLTHFGIQVEDAAAARAMYESRGASPTEIRSGRTNAILADILDPQGVRIELSEYPPDSLQGQALAGH